MSTNELQHVKMAWLAAEEAGDKQAQFALLRDHPDMQEALIDFIAAYHSSAPASLETVLPLTRRAMQTAIGRVFNESPQTATSAGDLRSLRLQQGLSLAQAARGLRLGADVWKKFEDGLIELASLSERQRERLARFFHISAEQFGQLLLGSQPLMGVNRRQTAQAAREQPIHKQTFQDALEKSAMSKADKKAWQE